MDEAPGGATRRIDNGLSFFHHDSDMDVTRFTRVFLDSLSTDELVKLADSHGIDIPPDLERIFVIEELL